MEMNLNCSSPHLLRKMKSRDVEKLQSHLPHLRRVKEVDATWNFAHSTISMALKKLAVDTRMNCGLVPVCTI